MPVCSYPAQTIGGRKKNTSGLKPTFSKDNTGFNVFVEQDDRRLKLESFKTRSEDPLVIYLPETMIFLKLTDNVTF